MQLKSLLLCTLLALPVQAQNLESLEPYYASLKDGFSVEDLDQLGPLSPEQKEIASTLVTFYYRIPEGLFSQCSSNLKNLGIALEMFSTDQKEYPPDLRALSPSYLLVAPACPTTENSPYRYQRQGKDYKITCPGDHTAFGITTLTYDGQTGLQPDQGRVIPQKLDRYAFDELDEYSRESMERAKENWSREGAQTAHVTLYRGSNDGGIDRAWALSEEGTAKWEMADALDLFEAYFRKDPLVRDEDVVSAVQAMGPAMAGLTVHRFVTAPEYAEARRAFASLKSQE